jgi:ribosome biogenesis GTPase A
MESLVKQENKLLIYVINKTDLTDVKETLNKVNSLNLRPFVLYSCKSPIGRNKLRTLIKIIVKRQKFAEKHTKAHVGVIGYPNTGKSTLINTLAAGGKAAASPEFAFTRGIKKIRLTKDILILDTPGVFKENENINISSEDLKRQTEIGVRNAELAKNPEYTIHKLMEENKDLFEKFYSIDANGDSEILIDRLGRKKGFLRSGNQVDSDKTARYILKDWQSGKMKLPLS